MLAHSSRRIYPNGRVHWDRYVHPEGNPYYYHEEKHMLTVCDTYDDDVHNCLRAVEIELKKRMRELLPLERVESEFPETLPDIAIQSDEWHYGIPYWEVCVTVDTDSNECSYYIADWKNRCLFWVEDDPDSLPKDDPHILDNRKLKIPTPVSWEHTRIVYYRTCRRIPLSTSP